MSLAFLFCQLGPLSEVRALYDTVRTLSAQFTEIAVYEFGASDTFRGVMYLAKPRMVRLEVSYPESQLVVSDGNTAWLFVPADSQAIKQSVGDLARALDPGILLFGEGDWDLAYRREGNLHVYTVLPRGAAPYTKAEVALSDSFLPVWFAAEAEGATFRFELREVRLNPPLSRDAFRFTPPPWARVFGE